jgi:hypothetical protein
MDTQDVTAVFCVLLAVSPALRGWLAGQRLGLNRMGAALWVADQAKGLLLTLVLLLLVAIYPTVIAPLFNGSRRSQRVVLPNDAVALPPRNAHA